ncbi:MAG: glutathione S-transferase family protein [Hyphomicrobiales bacterium]
MPDYIFHHYPPSPVAEKIRKAFGIKGLKWHGVEENRLPPRPELFAMSGGYRRIPVLQIGADIYCDTQCIIGELEAREPEPTLFPIGIGGMPYALSRWSDDELFTHAFKAVLAPVAGDLPAEFVADRARLYLGANNDMAKEAADMPHTLSQLRAMMGWVDARFQSGDRFILGDQPAMPDLLVWYIVWFLRERYGDAAAFFEEFEALNQWADRMSAVGYGEQKSMSCTEALAIAKSAEPQAPSFGDARDPQGLTVGMNVTIEPLTESGETPITGRLHAVGRDVVALYMKNDACGATAVHFPRVGYRVRVVV